MPDANFWKKYFGVYDCLNLLISYQELLDEVCIALDIRKGEKILEAGCGTGNLALKIKERGGDVTGLDNCEEAIKIYKRKDPVARTILADLSRELPFSDNYFDKIALNNTLYAFPRPKQEAILREMLRILKPGGKIVLSNPRKGWDPKKIYTASIKENVKREGYLRTAQKILYLIGPTLKIFYYNIQIQKSSDYNFLTDKEQETILQNTGFTNISKSKSVYAGQSILTVGYKPEAVQA